jgi:hypothetical protein
MTKRKRGGQPGNQNARKHGFYSTVLTEAEKLEVEDASLVSGLDSEIALLRVKLKELAEQHPDRLDLHIEAATAIAKLVKTSYQITNEQKRSLKDAVFKVLTEVAVPLGIGVGEGISK